MIDLMTYFQLFATSVFLFILYSTTDKNVVGIFSDVSNSKSFFPHLQGICNH